MQNFVKYAIISPKLWSLLLFLSMFLCFSTFSSTKAEASTTFNDDFTDCSVLGQPIATYDANYQNLLEDFLYNQDSTCFSGFVQTGGTGTPTNPSTSATYKLYPGDQGSYVFANVNIGNATGWLGMLGQLSTPCTSCQTTGYWLYLYSDGSFHLMYDILKGVQPGSGYGSDTSLLVAPILTGLDSSKDHTIQFNVDLSNNFSVTIDGSSSGTLAQDSTYKNGLFTFGGLGSNFYSWGFYANSQVATCSTFDFICELCNVFCFPTSFAQTQYTSLINLSNTKAPFAYVNAALAFDTSAVASSDAVLPLTVNIATIEAIPQIGMPAQAGMSITTSDTDNKIHDFLFTYERPIVTLFLWLMLIMYFWILAQRIFI